MSESLRIVFMGTPDFAVATLRALVENNHNIVGVITALTNPRAEVVKFEPQPSSNMPWSKGSHCFNPPT